MKLIQSNAPQKSEKTYEPHPKRGFQKSLIKKKMVSAPMKFRPWDFLQTFKLSPRVFNNVYATMIEWGSTTRIEIT